MHAIHRVWRHSFPHMPLTDSPAQNCNLSSTHHSSAFDDYQDPNQKHIIHTERAEQRRGRKRTRNAILPSSSHQGKCCPAHEDMAHIQQQETRKRMTTRVVREKGKDPEPYSLPALHKIKGKHVNSSLSISVLLWWFLFTGNTTAIPSHSLLSLIHVHHSGTRRTQTVVPPALLSHRERKEEVRRAEQRRPISSRIASGCLNKSSGQSEEIAGFACEKSYVCITQSFV